MTTYWTYNDVPISKFKIVTTPNLVTGEIKQITRIMEQIQEEVIQTKSDQIRNALIDLGWTPPEGKEFMPPTKLPGRFRENYLPKADQCHYYGEQITKLPYHDLLAVTAALIEDALRQPSNRHRLVGPESV